MLQLSGDPFVATLSNPQNQCFIALTDYGVGISSFRNIFERSPPEQLSGDPFVATLSNPRNQCFIALADQGFEMDQKTKFEGLSN